MLSMLEKKANSKKSKVSKTNKKNLKILSKFPVWDSKKSISIKEQRKLVGY